MEYLITAPGPFAAIEERVIHTLERMGFAVRRTFSLHSATEREAQKDRPGYSVLMLYACETSCPPVGLLTLYEWEGQVVVQTAPTGPLSAVDDDVEAEWIAALTMEGLQPCRCRQQGG